MHNKTGKVYYTITSHDALHTENDLNITQRNIPISASRSVTADVQSDVHLFPGCNTDICATDGQRRRSLS